MKKEEILILVRYQLGFTDNLPDYIVEEYDLKKGYSGRWEVDIIKYPVQVGPLDDFIEEFRKKFAKYPNLKGNRGQKAQIKQRLEWFIKTTGYSLEEISRATDRYIDQCVKLGRYLLDPHYFIWKEGTSRKKTLDDSRLYEFITDVSEDNFESTYEI